VASSRRYDFCLILGWLYTVTVTCVIFAFAYMALHRIDSSSLKSAEGANFWAFLGFSLGALTPTKASSIASAKSTATVHADRSAAWPRQYDAIVPAIPPFYWRRFQHAYRGLRTMVARPPDALFYQDEQAYYMGFARSLGYPVERHPEIRLPIGIALRARAFFYSGEKPLPQIAVAVAAMKDARLAKAAANPKSK
jgi:hypothetical protein